MSEYLKMSMREFKLFQELVYQVTGIDIPDRKITLLSNRIIKRLQALNIQNYHEYYLFLKNTDSKNYEMINLINAVTTHVTNFFRNPKQWDLFHTSVLKKAIQNNEERRSIRILSAGCSTGEEPYSIAIILKEYFEKDYPVWNFEIHAVDISTQAIKEAEEGIYGKEILHDVKKDLLEKYFIREDSDKYRIIDPVKKMVVFRRFNLKSDRFIMKFDIIFCRNVVIYFDEETKFNIYQKFFEALNPGGYLMVGHSEGLIQDNRFLFQMPGIYIKNLNYQINT